MSNPLPQDHTSAEPIPVLDQDIAANAHPMNNDLPSSRAQQADIQPPSSSSPVIEQPQLQHVHSPHSHPIHQNISPLSKPSNIETVNDPATSTDYIIEEDHTNASKQKSQSMPSTPDSSSPSYLL